MRSKDFHKGDPQGGPYNTLAVPVTTQNAEIQAFENGLKQTLDFPNIASGSANHDEVTDDKSEVWIKQQPSPLYGATAGAVDCTDEAMETKAVVSEDGRLDINIYQKSRHFADLLASALETQPDGSVPTIRPLDNSHNQATLPPLNIVIHVVGSRGDVQPFVALGKELKEKYGHRVRLATHGTFKGFVEDNGLEFFSIGGDPAELMAFMVKNPGLIPGMDSIRSGDVGKRRKGMYEIFQGCWQSCIEAGDGCHVSKHDNSARPFVADAIIANPPSFAHIHCAEKLGIPLHLMFTTTNSVSYSLVEMMTWRGLGGLINDFRQRFLGLEPMSLVWAPGLEARLKIPYTYCWSPALIPKPKDWGPHISVSGFYFLSLASSFTPAPELQAFLDAGPPPVYIGFGSIVVNDPNAMTKLIFEAVKKTGQRALVSKGWGGFGADKMGIPNGVFMLGNVPHDWLFKHVSCVVHHGGAGTTAAGIALGKPTVVVPFFGDQPFWGAMIARAGAGPLPIPHKQLNAENLAAGIMTCLEPRTLERAKELGTRISSERGTDVGAESFHQGLDVDSLRCAVSPNRAAVWQVERTTTRLSAFAATTLCEEGLLDFSELKLYRPKDYIIEDGPWDPISASFTSAFSSAGSMVMSVAEVPRETMRAIQDNKSNKPKEAARSPSADMPGPSTSPQEQASGPASLRRSSTSKVSAFSKNAALGASKGMGNMVGAGLKIPQTVTLDLAQGFHNAPRLYGDDTVRKADKVTGIQSGLKAAGKGFTLGIYDGISGLATQPVRGAQKGGVTGFLKGFGKGIGGAVLKPSAAACSLPGYTFKGIHKEVQKLLRPSAQNDIVASRIAQGNEDWKSSSRLEQLDVVNRWRTIQADLGLDKRSKRQGQGKLEAPGLEAGEDKLAEVPEQRDVETPDIPISLSSATPSEIESVDIQRAIKQSVAATSKNAEENEQNEKAIRASLLRLRGDSSRDSRSEAGASQDQSLSTAAQFKVSKGDMGQDV
ncbi:MAG: hypothetical protein Q9170_006662 [Blastenia crenularia]